MTVRNVRMAVVGLSLLIPLAFASSAFALTASCTGTPSASTITWSASISNGVAPYALLWGNGATTSTQTVNATVGTHTMSLQATDASSTVATTTCSATVAATSTGSTAISAQIQALLAQINALKAQIAQLLVQAGTGSGSAATSTPTTCFKFWRDLKHGDIGDDVRELQQQLAHDDPTLFPPGLVTGFFGPKTEAAVKMWQRRYEIDMQGTGFFGMKSRGHFASQCGDGDRDNDGTSNSDDTDDDNDGTPDEDDTFPFNPNATSTKMKWDDRMMKWKYDNSGRGNSANDDDDDEDDD